MAPVLYVADILLAGRELDKVEGGAVLVEDGHIAAVGKRGDFAGFAGERVERPLIMPGLVDCHAHMALDAGIRDWPGLVADPEAEHVLRAVAALRADLRSGVTTARYMGDKYFIDVALRRALREGGIAGPRAVVATRGIKASHAHGLVGYPVDGAEERRRFVRENIRAGADFIKLFVTDAVLRPIMYCYPSREEIGAAVDEAHNVGKPVAAHVAGGPGWDVCLEAGVDSFEHGYFATREQFDGLARAGRWLDITPTPIMSDYYAERCPSGMASALAASREALVRSMREAVRSGVRYAVGSDGLHGFLAGDVQYLVDFGASQLEALRAATIRGAELCGVADVTGSIEVGKCADLVGLDAGGIAAAALKRVTLVVREGRPVPLAG
ncbi:MAG: amidohydrolase family protein [Planctomycetota bacterium]|jgi:imidazolonepropionase-like amidohydrolase|nr:amidohydrolase family protein [Planctomycetota bacterium]